MTAKEILPLLVAVLIPVSALAREKPTTSRGRHEILQGRVIADVASTAFGAGLGPEWVTFVFMAEAVDGKAFPVRIAYAFYKTDQLPPDSFWDYATLYKLDVQRDPTCDTTGQAISHEKAVDEKGRELPPLKILISAKNAPPDLLKPEATLPCYVLWYGHYKRVDSAGSH